MSIPLFLAARAALAAYSHTTRDHATFATILHRLLTSAFDDSRL
jgi:hypothetical protein